MSEPTVPNPVIQARNARNRRRGSGWEYTLRTGLRDSGFDTEGLKKTGAKDEGDLVVRAADKPFLPDFVVIEAKAATMKPADFVRQAILEADHFAENRRLSRDRVRGIAVIKRNNMNWRDAYVLTTLEEYLGMEAR